MTPSKQYRRVMAEQAGVDVENLQEGLGHFLVLAAGINTHADAAHTDEARNALREVAAQITDYVVPTMAQAVSDIEELYHVSRHGAVDSEE